MAIKPITIRLVAYGQKANVAAIRTRAAAMLKDEHGKADPACFAEVTAEVAHDEIAAQRREPQPDLRKPTPAQAGIVLTLPEVNEKMAGEWLAELPVARTCVAFATWISHREGLSWQILFAEGAKGYHNQPAG